MTDQRLLRHLVLAVRVKLAVLAVLSWAFVRDDRVTVDMGKAAQHVGAARVPEVMPSSSMPAASPTVRDVVLSHVTLGLMFWATVIFMPLIVFYTGWASRHTAY